jgi:hypothetical protein
MLTALIVLSLVATVAVLGLLALVAAAIRWERPTTRLASQPSGPITAIVRHLLGVYVSKPDLTGTDADRHLTGHATGRHNEGW